MRSLDRKLGAICRAVAVKVAEGQHREAKLERAEATEAEGVWPGGAGAEGRSGAGPGGGAGVRALAPAGLPSGGAAPRALLHRPHRAACASSTSWL